MTLNIFSGDYIVLRVWLALPWSLNICYDNGKLAVIISISDRNELIYKGPFYHLSILTFRFWQAHIFYFRIALVTTSIFSPERN